MLRPGKTPISSNLRTRSRRVFYVVYLQDSLLNDCLDAIRLLANPSEKCHSHITVRGPYERRLARRYLNSYGEGIAGAAVTLGQPNNFFDANQPTVFFECSAPRLQRLWKKPDFPTFSPHLTVYDGPSLEFAEKLFNVIDSYHYDITCRIKKLSEFVSIGGQSSMVLRLSFNADTIAAIAGEVIAPNEVWHMPETRRLQLIDRLCGHLAHPSAADSLVSTKR